ncbi:MAG TPA: hypothetical protein DIT25_04150 [Candidatus Moranbacteria bacterium]|nr:hypothetical protein [Candidatus Moranbacteria bacterium]
MSKKIIFSALFLGLSFAAAGIFLPRNDATEADPEQSAEITHKIGFITDVHAYRSKTGFITPKASAGLESFVNRMNSSFRPDFVVQGGDFIEGTNRFGEKSIADFLEVKIIYDRIEAPRYDVVGNHDMRGLTKDEWRSLTENESAYYFFDTGNLRTIVLDSNEKKEESFSEFEETLPKGYLISDNQINWLEETLKNSERMKKIVFIHVPLIANREMGEPAGKEIFYDHILRIREILERYGVEAVFSGHIEKLHYREVNGVKYFILPGLYRSEKKKVLWKDCFHEITITDDVEVKMFYKKEGDADYKELIIPSSEYDAIEK